MRRTGFLTLLLAVLALVAPGSNAPAYDLFGSDIPGGGIQANVDACAAVCNANPSCQAFTWIAVSGPRALPVGSCFLKNSVPTPSFNPDCPSNAACKSGFKTASWCGETPARDVAPGVPGQDVVLSCPASAPTCGPRRSQNCEGWFIFKSCSPTQTTDFFCQQ
jgi:hypothetical protein